MIEPLAPQAQPARPWIVRMIGPRPAPTLALQLAEVLRRTLWILPLEMLAAALLAGFGIQQGNAGEDKIEALLRGGALRSLVIAGLVAPAVEELMFRWLPSWLSDVTLQRKGGMRWRLGLCMALSFALVHNLKTEPDEHSLALVFGLHLATNAWPVAQFVFGILLWDLMRRHGWWACMLSHMLHNLILVGLTLSYFESTP
jgi:membrane protease YdiL (CAAX protease family)